MLPKTFPNIFKMSTPQLGSVHGSSAASGAPSAFFLGQSGPSGIDPGIRVPSTGTLERHGGTVTPDGSAASASSSVLRKRALVARRKFEAAQLQLEAEETELLALEASSGRSRSRSVHGRISASIKKQKESPSSIKHQFSHHWQLH